MPILFIPELPVPLSHSTRWVGALVSDGWMDGRMDRCMDGWMARWMDGWMSECMGIDKEQFRAREDKELGLSGQSPPVGTLTLYSNLL